MPIHNPERIAPAIIAPDRTTLGQRAIALTAIRPQGLIVVVHRRLSKVRASRR